MKKVLLFSMLIILIPFIVVNIFFKKEEISFSHIDSFKVRIKRADKIDKVYFEDYIVGVLAGEMPVSFDIEALKAQAVAARSYALIKINENKGKDYDLVDTVMNQVYLDYEYLKKTWKNDYINNINKIKEAVQKTEGQYLEYNGEIAYTFFFSTSTGKTENSEEIFGTEKPYLKSVDSKWDDISPVFTENIFFSKSEFFKKLSLPSSSILNVNYIETTSTGRNKKIIINNVEFQASKVMEILNLRSTYFKINSENDIIKIVSKGYGHGVGMSQYGAQAMALKNYKYDEILKYYYQNTKISCIKK